MTIEYEAYVKMQVASKLPLDIQCLATHGAKVLAGTKNGCLLIYEPNRDSRRSYDVNMCRNFARNKCIQQMQIVAEHDLLICLTDSVISVHDTQQINYPVIVSMPKTKGCTLFDTYCDSKSKDVFLCTVNRRKVQCYRWLAREFTEITALDVTFADNVHRIEWCDRLTLAVAVRDEYFLVDLHDFDEPCSSSTVVLANANSTTTSTPSPVTSPPNQSFTMTSLFTTGTNTGNTKNEPLILIMRHDLLLALLRDDTLIFVHWQTKQITRLYNQLKFSEAPSAIAYDAPYIFAVNSKQTEVYSLKPQHLVQTIIHSGNTPRCTTHGLSLHMFQSSANDLWLWTAAPNLKSNCQRLCREQNYELALRLAEQIKDDSADINNIKHKYATHLFCQKQFAAAFDLCREIDSEVLYVIGLFPGMLPEDIRANLHYPQHLPASFSEDERKTGLFALTKYLSEVRTRLAYGLQMQPKMKLKAERGQTLNDTEQEYNWTKEHLNQNKTLLQIIDTTLLRCYLETNDSLVASLLRLPDNSCIVSDTEQLLLNKEKYYELYLLYERKNMHVQALNLLKKHWKNDKSRLSGLDRSVNYLQDLGNTNLDLILEYADWVMREDATLGLTIFTEQCAECENLNRERVLAFLLRNAQSAVIPYLEHIIHEWSDDSSLFHDQLAEHYVIKVKQLMEHFVDSLPEGHEVPPAGREPGELGEIRSKLLKFLESSLLYTPERLLAQLPHHSLYEERALLLGRLQRHEQALAIYTNVLHDHNAAEHYCAQHYNTTDAHAKQVYLLLLRMYAKPPDMSIIGLLHSTIPRAKPNVPLALRVLERHAAAIDTLQAMEHIADEMKLSELWLALESVLQHTANRRRGAEIHSGLYAANKMECRHKLMGVQSTRVDITANTVCTLCNKRISNSAFVRNSNGTLCHYYCYRQTDN